MNKKMLEQLLEQEPSDDTIMIPKQRRSPVSQVYITKGALGKVYAYARLACDVLEESVECYGYLITFKDAKDRIVRDVYLVPNQKVSPAHVEVGGEDVIKAGRTIDRMGYKVLGWWHSHADFDTFHSGIDDENMMGILNILAPTNFVVTQRQMPLLRGKLGTRRRGGNLEVYEANNPSRRLILNVPKGKPFDIHQLIAIQDIMVNMPIKVGFAYSIVVNAVGNRAYAEIATKEFCGLCYEGGEQSRKTRLNVVKDDSLKFDEKELAMEIKQKIKKPKPIISTLLEGGKNLINEIRGGFILPYENEPD